MSALYASSPSDLVRTKTLMRHKARDNGRTPVQWTSTPPNAGFCPPDVTPWMRVNTDHITVNAEAQTVPGAPSVYHFWQRQLDLRRQHPEVFVYGRFGLVDEENTEVFSFVRTAESGERWFTVLNFTGGDAAWSPGEEALGKVQWVVGNYFEDGQKVAPQIDDGKVKLRPWEGLLGRVAV